MPWGMKALIRLPGRSKRLFSSGARNVLVVTPTVPDPTASAAGVRTRSLLDGLTRSLGSSEQVHLLTSTQLKQTQQVPSHDSHSMAILPPNRSDLLEEFAKQHPTFDFILFDRFYMEEAYSFALRQHFPDATLVLDMQDVHSLRRGRQSVVEEWDAAKEGEDPLEVLPWVMEHIPSTSDGMLLRELASIHRCDLTLVCSPTERTLLGKYGISPDKLCESPFFVDPTTIRTTAIDEKTSQHNFVFCGGFKHEPNVDAVRLLLKTVWPQLRGKLPDANLHIHGAFCPTEFAKQHNPQKGVFVHGYTESLDEVFQPGGILLAPLRFGAGLKGKLIDAWRYGLPVVTTPIGAEGLAFEGLGVAQTTTEFVDQAVELAIAPQSYQAAVERGQTKLRQSQGRDANWQRVWAALQKVSHDLAERRSSDYSQAMLWHESNRSTEYFSRWIELKDRIRQLDTAKPPTRKE